MTKKRPDTRIQKHGNGHSYYLDGAKVPGVTTILSNGIPKPALVGWAGNTVADFVVDRLEVADDGKTIIADRLVDDALEWNGSRGSHAAKTSNDRLPRLGLARILGSIRYRDSTAAAAKGTVVHKLAERLALGEEIEVPEGTEGHVDSYLRFLELWQPEDALVEVVVVSRRYRYMGKTDLICYSDPLGDWVRENVNPDLEGPARCLLDIKTSRSGIFPETALQLHGYGFAETIVDNAGDEEPLGEFDFFGAVWVRADGFDLVPIRIDPNTHRAFLYAQQVGNWLSREGGSADAILPAIFAG